MKVKLTDEEAVIVKSVLQRHAFEANWYRRNESDVCVSVVDRINHRMARP